MQRKNIVFVILLIVTATIASADTTAPVHQLDFLAGSWKCTGDVFETPMAPARKSAGTVDVKWGHNDNWLAFTYAEKKTAASPMPVTFSGYMGYDPETKQYVIVGVDSLGGYSNATASGMTGNSFVFVGPWHMGTMTANGRDTFTRTSNRAITHTGEVEMDGQWVKYTQETCTK